MTDGGVGLQTGDNGRFLAVLEGTEVARKLEERLKDFESKWRRKEPKIYETYQELLTKCSRNDALDQLRKKFDEKNWVFPEGLFTRLLKKMMSLMLPPILKTLSQSYRIL